MAYNNPPKEGKWHDLRKKQVAEDVQLRKDASKLYTMQHNRHERERVKLLKEVSEKHRLGTASAAAEELGLSITGMKQAMASRKVKIPLSWASWKRD